ncbi:MAG: hypothetical protein KC586_03440, partial [Myxococcales bacterium]|nr:hypothetical protein [Myxococcales bacterium]
MSLSSLTIRPRELTVGELGPLRMAGELPPASGYTYAVELGVEGANGHVRFEADAGSEARVGPVILHIDNFLGFAVGEGVPVGAYERDAGRWVAESNGLVVGLVGEVEGLAELDFDGDGAPESEEVLAAWAVTEFELRQLASQREPGDTFWRVPTSHFSLIDCNWPLAFPTDAIDALLAFLGLDAFTEDTCYNGSEIRLERQVLAEHMDIPGTPFSLTYSSDRQVGYEANRTVRVQVTPDSIPSSMRQVHVELLIAGRRVRRTYPAAPSLIFEYAWDGTDVYGRRFRGAMPYEIRVGYGYQGTYASSAIASRDPFPTEGGGWFGFPGTSRNDRTLTREEVIRWRSERRFLSYDDARREGLLGLTLDVHHRYEPTSQTLLRGDGGRARARAMPLVIDRVAGGGSSTSPDVPARSFRLQSPTGLTVGDDGQVYVATNDSRIWRIDRDGILHHFAGNGDNATSGDGGLAVDAGIANPEHLAWGPDGSLYIGCVSEAASDECARIRRVRPDGVIETVAGNGTNARRMGDGLRAVDAPLEEPRLLAFGDDGTLYFVDGALYLRAVGTDGVLRTLNPSRRSSDDGTLLASADLGSIGGLAYDARDGSLYVGSNRRGGTIYRVTPDGFLRRYAGGNGAP